jgi:sugar phosphate isomerase/epimerase
MSLSLDRRQLLAATSAFVATSAFGAQPAAAPRRSRSGEPFLFCLNTSTIRGQKLPLDRQTEVVIEAGYDAIEPWLGDIQAYHQSGKSLSDLAKRLADKNVTVESAIGFAQWIVDDDTQRAKGLEQARRDMDLVKQLGGTRIAAPPAGATDRADLNLLKAAERYRKLCEIGDSIGVVPQVEVWGFSKCLSRLGETTLVAQESGHPKACILPDIYHLYKGGSEFGGLRFLHGSVVHVFHVNDYPADPPRATINDSHRVYPGDGVAPVASILRTLHDNGFRGVLSLELFNPQYWKRDAQEVAKTGLEKMRAAVRQALV